MRWSHGTSLARLGLLVGLCEGVAVVRWDWLMGDPRPERVGVGLLWILGIVALQGLVWGLLGLVCRGSAVASTALYLVLVVLARRWVIDRFDVFILVAVVPIVLLVLFLRGRPRAWGLLAFALAVPALWGRVPNYTWSSFERIGFLLPSLVAGVAFGALTLEDLRHRRAVVTAAAGILAIGGGLVLASGRAEAGRAGRPNLLIVLVDTLRRDHVDPAHFEEGAFARVAKEGVWFEDAVAVIPKTSQSVASLLTGRYPSTTGVRALTDSLPERERTLAEELSGEGYATAGFVHNGWIQRGKGFEQGFDQFWSYHEVERPWGPLRLSGAGVILDALTGRRTPVFDGNTDATVLTDRALEWADSVPEPFFGYVHYFDPHWPYRPPGQDAACQVNDFEELGGRRDELIFVSDLPEQEHERARELYAEEVAFNDAQIHRLLDGMEERGLLENTVVVLTADHGHHLGDHEYHYHHGEFLYEPGLAIPLAIRAPSGIEPGTVVSELVSLVDLTPTLLSLLGVGGAGEFDGVDVFDEPPDGAVFLETDCGHFALNHRRYLTGVLGKVRGVRRGPWKLIYTPREGDGLWELYDLRTDPGEQHNLIPGGEAPDAVVLELLAELEARIPAEEREELQALGNRFDRVPTGPQDFEPAGTRREAGEELDSRDRRLLEALGYVGDD